MARPEAPELEALQRLFYRAISWPRGTRDFLASADEATRREFEAAFACSAGFDAVERIDVYADAYFYRQLAALRDVYPRLARLAGATAFHNLVTDYVLELPSRDPDLRHRGDALPELIARHELGARRPWLTDLARLERALAHALDAPGVPADLEAVLRALPAALWGELRLVLAPAATRLTTRWDLAAVIRAADESDGHPAATALAASMPPGDPRELLVGRAGQHVYVRELEAAEAHALDGFAAGASFATICERAAGDVASFSPEHMVSYLRRWIQDEVVCR